MRLDGQVEEGFYKVQEGPTSKIGHPGVYTQSVYRIQKKPKARGQVILYNRLLQSQSPIPPFFCLANMGEQQDRRV